MKNNKGLEIIKAIIFGISVLAGMVLVCGIVFMVILYSSAAKKPVIYLYPEKQQVVNVTVDYKGEFTCTYPEYNGGWSVKASPDGTLINLEDKKEYSYLYWEGKDKKKWDITEGFVVEGKDTASFLQEKLAYMGLTPKEYNEFIVYWLPQMEDNKYNLIYFAGDDYEELAKLVIDPKPDSILRVFMVFKSLNKPIMIEEEQLDPFEREGFSVIEWGGTEVK